MKRTLLIVVGLMALCLPIHAAQIAQADEADQVDVNQQADQDEMSQQAEPIQTETNARSIIVSGERRYY